MSFYRPIHSKYPKVCTKGSKLMLTRNQRLFLLVLLCRARRKETMSTTLTRSATSINFQTSQDNLNLIFFPFFFLVTLRNWRLSFWNKPTKQKRQSKLQILLSLLSTLVNSISSSFIQVNQRGLLLASKHSPIGFHFGAKLGNKQKNKCFVAILDERFSQNCAVITSDFQPFILKS